MRVEREKNVSESLLICDRCGAEIDPESGSSEFAESVSISFRAGFASVFGDGNFVHGDFCQTCVQQALGKYLKVSPDDPLIKPLFGPRGAYQPSQSVQHQAHDTIVWAVARLTEEISEQVARQLDKRRLSPEEISDSISDLRLRLLRSDSK